jgi:hypothetical protein
VLEFAREAGGAEKTAQPPEAVEAKPAAQVGGLITLADAKATLNEIAEIAGEAVSGQVSRLRSFLDSLTKE